MTYTSLTDGITLGTTEKIFKKSNSTWEPKEVHHTVKKFIVKDYIQEAERQLSDEKFFKKLPTNPTTLHAELVNNAIEQLRNRNLIHEKVAQSLKVSNPRTPQFYLLPKIHKVNHPVISPINCHTESISQFVDYHLHPLAKKLPSYIQDTTDFLRKLNQLSKYLPWMLYLFTLIYRMMKG